MREGAGGGSAHRIKDQEDNFLKCQIGTSSLGWGGRRKGPLTGKMGEFSFYL
jgi:hypothetical protein